MGADTTPRGWISTLGVSAFVCLFAASVSADESLPVQIPDLKPGDSWHFWQSGSSVRARKFKVQVDRIDSKEIHGFVQVPGGRETNATWTREWNSQQSHFYLDIFYDSPVCTLRFPLAVGASWAYSYKQVSERNNPADYTWELKAKVVGWEDVVVEAGSFRALRVDTEALRRARGSNAPYEWKVLGVSWYSPAAKRSIKTMTRTLDTQGRERGSSASELLDYKLQ